MILLKMFLAAVSAVLYALALPNETLHYGNLFIGFIALVPLFHSLYNASNIKESILTGAVFGLISTVSVYFWLLYFQDFSIWTLSGTTAAHMLYFAVLGPFIWQAGQYRTLRPFITAAVWVSYEFLKSGGYLGFPWGLMVHTAGIAPFVQIADITGQWGPSFLITSVNTLILETITVSRKTIARSWVFLIFLFLISTVYGIYISSGTLSPGKKLTLTLVQQDADSWISGYEMESIRKGQELTRKELDKNGRKPDLVVWSENSFRFAYTEASERYRDNPEGDPFRSFMEEIETPLLAGSPYILDRSAHSALNSVLMISPEGEILQYYGKNHPVPFAEHIPFWEFSIVESFFRKYIGLNNPGWTLGEPNVLFKVNTEEGDTVSFGVPICFEDSFPYLCRNFIRKGADLLINLSNDSWSKTISGETQHFAAARLRAVENRRYLVRSTNAGVTAVIDPFGRTSHTLPLYTSGAVTAEIELSNRGMTVYTRTGDWFPVLLIISLIIFRIYTLYRRLRQNQHSATELIL